MAERTLTEALAAARLALRKATVRRENAIKDLEAADIEVKGLEYALARMEAAAAEPMEGEE